MDIQRPKRTSTGAKAQVGLSTAALVAERDLSQAVVDMAMWMRWKVYRTWNSQHSPAGYPDLTMTRDGRLIFAELKRPAKNPTTEQEEWLTAFRKVPGAEVYVWRPSDWQDGGVEAVLR